jgi:enhancing lycopene biosynthesis protein 2
MVVAGILAGCGFMDGAEIQEVVITLLAFESRGIEVQWFAPNRMQHHVVKHTSGETETSKRNILEESARIVRGEIQDLKNLEPHRYDGLVFPGGFGVAKNLCSFAFDGASMSVDPLIAHLIKNFYASKKPMAFICIAPVLAAFVLGQAGLPVRLSIGDNVDVAKAIEGWGAEHVNTRPEDCCVDKTHRIVSTGAWNCAQKATQVEQGIHALAEAYKEMQVSL